MRQIDGSHRKDDAPLRKVVVGSRNSIHLVVKPVEVPNKWAGIRFRRSIKAKSISAAPLSLEPLLPRRNAHRKKQQRSGRIVEPRRRRSSDKSI